MKKKETTLISGLRSAFGKYIEEESVHTVFLTLLRRLSRNLPPTKMEKNNFLESLSAATAVKEWECTNCETKGEFSTLIGFVEIPRSKAENIGKRVTSFILKQLQSEVKETKCCDEPVIEIKGGSLSFSPYLIIFQRQDDEDEEHLETDDHNLPIDWIQIDNGDQDQLHLVSSVYLDEEHGGWYTYRQHTDGKSFAMGCTLIRKPGDLRTKIEDASVLIYRLGPRALSKQINLKTFLGGLASQNLQSQHFWFQAQMYLELPSTTWWADTVWSCLEDYLKLGFPDSAFLFPNWHTNGLPKVLRTKKLVFAINNENGVHFTCFVFFKLGETNRGIYFNSLKSTDTFYQQINDMFCQEFKVRLETLKERQPLQPDSDSCLFFVAEFITKILKIDKEYNSNPEVTIRVVAKQMQQNLTSVMEVRHAKLNFLKRWQKKTLKRVT